MQFIISLSILLLLIAHSSPLLADETTLEEQVVQPTKRQSTLSKTFQWFENQQQFVTGKVTASGRTIDRYVARDSFDEEKPNQSYAKLNLKNRVEEGFDNTFESDIKLRFDLPNSKRKLKLIFDSDPDDFDPLSDKARDINTGSDSLDEKKDEAIAGIQVDGQRFGRWKSKYQAGIRLKLPVDPFTRARFQRRDKLSEFWESKIEQRFFYFKSQGFGSDTSIDFLRPLTDARLIKVSSEFQFLDSENEWEISQTASYYMPFQTIATLQHQVGVSALSNPNYNVDNYWYRAIWRQALYKDWLFGKIVPEISFPRENDFDATASILFELEIFFSDNNNERIRKNGY